MAMLSKILVPVVFSARCQDATRYAAALSCRFHCDLVLLHVFLEPWAAFSAPEGYATPPPYDRESILEEVESQLAEFMSDDLRNLSVKCELRDGDPAVAIADYARTEGCDLIVMPTHGYGRFRRFLLGSVTAKVLHDAPCPVLTGPHLEHPPVLESPRFRKILCAVDLGSESRCALGWASRTAAEFGSELAVVHVLPTSLTHLGGVYFDPAWRADATTNAREQVACLQQEMHTQGEILVEVGDVPAAVRATAAAIGADLVVIGRGHSHGVLGRLRTNSYGIIREAPCPVLAV